MFQSTIQGSAFRCLKTGDPIDSVLERAARESGVPIADILENLPAELSVWVDPGEVSYRIGEKGAVKVSYFIVLFSAYLITVYCLHRFSTRKIVTIMKTTHRPIVRSIRPSILKRNAFVPSMRSIQA